MISRDHGKTTWFTACNAHDLIRDPEDARIMQVSAERGLARGIVGSVRQILWGEIELVPNSGYWVPIGSIFPRALPIGRREGATVSCDAFSVQGRSGPNPQHSLFTKSVNSNMAGIHPDRARIDDPINEKLSRNPDTVAEVNAFFDRLVPIMQDLEAPVDHIGTPWVFGDVSEFLQDHPDWSQARFGVYDGWNPVTGKRDGQGPCIEVPEIPASKGAWPLCSSFLDEHEIEATRKRVSSHAFFMSQYCVSPIAADRAMFELGALDSFTDTDLTEQLLLETWGCPEILLWDPVAKLKGVAGSKNGIVRLAQAPAPFFKQERGLDPSRSVYIITGAWIIPGSMDHGLAWLENQTQERKSVIELWIEDAGAQGALKGWLEERRRLNSGTRIRMVPTGNKAPIFRVQAIATGFRKGHLRALPNFEGRDALNKAMREYPIGESGEKNDLMMALAILSRPVFRGAKGPGPLEEPEVAVDKAHRIWHNNGPGPHHPLTSGYPWP